MAEKAISASVLNCEGRPVRIGDVLPRADNPVEVLIVTFENGSTKVGCTYLSDDKCTAGKNPSERQALPFCAHLFGIAEGAPILKRSINVPKGSVRVDGERIKSLRQQAELRQDQLAEEIGIDAGFLSKVETGKRKSLKRDKLESLAARLGTSVEELEFQS